MHNDAVFVLFQLISESKLKAFEEGTMIVGKKAMSKRELEEQRRKV